jgi:hypothetical protein
MLFTLFLGVFRHLPPGCLPPAIKCPSARGRRHENPLRAGNHGGSPVANFVLFLRQQVKHRLARRVSDARVPDGAAVVVVGAGLRACADYFCCFSSSTMASPMALPIWSMHLPLPI